MAATPQGLGVVNVYDNGNKAFNLLKGKPIWAVMWGAGGIGNASTSSLVKDFRNLLKEGPDGPNGYRLNPAAYTIEEVAIKLRRFIYEQNYIAAFASLPPDHRWTFAVRVIMSAIVLAASLFVLLRNNYPDATIKWAVGVAGLVIGHWLR